MHTAAVIAGKTIIALLIALLVLTAGLIGYVRWQGIRILSIQSASMQPAIKIGDAVLVRHLRNREDLAKDLRPAYIVGDIVNFTSPSNQSVSMTHRVISIDSPANTIRTKGDSSPRSDAVIPSSAVHGKVVRTIPHGGKTFDFLRSPAGLVIAVYVPAIILTAGEVSRLMRHYGMQRYKLHRRMY